MTPEKQRIAIAEACETMQWSYALPQKCVGASVPKYTEDLNAMHDAEKVLTEKGVDTWWAYVDLINRHNLIPFGQSTAVHATAAQRAEAFLRTIGKWEKNT